MEKFIIDYLAGVAGGVAVVLVGHPFDTTKTRLQTSPRGYYSSTIDCLRKTFANEGILGFYAGMYSPLLGQMFFRAASFSTFHTSVGLISRRNHTINGIYSPPTSSQLLAAGAVTGALVSVIEAPIDLIKTKLQIQVFRTGGNPQYTTLRDCVTVTIRQNGMKALWQGWTGTFIRNVPANALFFPVNEIVKMDLSRRNNCDVSSLALHHRLFAGACAGLCYWTLTYPLDVIKGKMQALPYEERRSWVGTIRDIYHSGGRGEFARGFYACAARAVPACAALFATTDCIRYELQKM